MTVPRVESVKDLGVTIDNRLQFDIHIDHIVQHMHIGLQI